MGIYPKSSFTLAEIARPSASPANFLEATPITLPMSFPLVAPVSAIISFSAEDTGVSYDNLALCDEWVKIPMLGTIESLNVSVAAGILIYEAVKQRNND